MFSKIRSYLPEYINDNVMYYAGRAQCLVQYYINNNFSASEITERIFIGDLASAANCNAMIEQGITHIISVFNGAYPTYPDNFEYKIIHINDDIWVDIGMYFDETNEYIDKVLTNPNTKIMIHCQRGASRSVTLLLAYLIYRINLENKIELGDIDIVLNKILKEVQSHRPIADPNPGFMDALKTYICEKNDYFLTTEIS